MPKAQGIAIGSMMKVYIVSATGDPMDRIDADVNRSNEDFIKHYNSKYDNPSMPPSWMALEVVSFATLSRLFQSLRLDSRKEYITEQFGLKKVAILENWLHSISNLRNCCAHHSRVWNRRFMVSVILPYNTLYPFMDRTTIRTNTHKQIICRAVLYRVYT